MSTSLPFATLHRRLQMQRTRCVDSSACRNHSQRKSYESLYKSRENYLKLFNEGIDKMVKERWLLPPDGEKLKQEEAQQAPSF